MESRNKSWGDLLCSNNWSQVITRQYSRYFFTPITLLNSCYLPLPATTGAMQKPRYQISQGLLISWQLFQVTICFGYKFSFTEPMSMFMPPYSPSQNLPHPVFILLDLSMSLPIVTLFPWPVLKMGLNRATLAYPNVFLLTLGLRVFWVKWCTPKICMLKS